MPLLEVSFLIFRSAKSVSDSLRRTRSGFFIEIARLFSQDEVSDPLWEQLEELLILADVGVGATTALIEELRREVSRRGIRQASQVQELLKDIMVKVLTDGVGAPIQPKGYMLTVVLVVGANGSGKTTSIAKLACYHMERGREVILAAADTFRAAALEQLKIWGERVGAEVIGHRPGSDPGAVVYDAIRASQSRGADVLIIDTAGRLHTKYNLMQELKKIKSVAAKQVHRAPHQTLLVLDATTGQNALSQAKHFGETVDITGIVLTKLDGTAKGGIIFAIARELGIPILFLTTGEGIEDLVEFDAEEFVAGLFE